MVVISHWRLLHTSRVLPVHVYNSVTSLLGLMCYGAGLGISMCVLSCWALREIWLNIFPKVKKFHWEEIFLSLRLRADHGLEALENSRIVSEIPSSIFHFEYCKANTVKQKLKAFIIYQHCSIKPQWFPSENNIAFKKKLIPTGNSTAKYYCLPVGI